MQMHWDELTFIHWRYDPLEIQRLLPPGVTAQTFDGSAWISLVPFVMRITLPGAPVPPYIGRFCETNVRTYVTAADGTEGIWFFSLDASRLAAVAAARVGFGLPYIWSSMTYSASGSRREYTCRRILGGARSRVTVDVGRRLAPDELSQADHFLSARWRLYARHFGRLRYAFASHEPWPLHEASIEALDDGLVFADGLPKPSGQPIVQYSPTVCVQISRPHTVPV